MSYTNMIYKMHLIYVLYSLTLSSFRIICCSLTFRLINNPQMKKYLHYPLQLEFSLPPVCIQFHLTFNLL